MTDIGFYKYLEAAFRYRLFNPQGMTATLNTRFNYLGYNLPFSRIFFYARRVLPKFYTSEFPDTEEGNLQMAKKVLEKLDRRQDTELNKYFDPTTAPTENIPPPTTTTQTETATQPPPEASKASFQVPRVPSPLVNTLKNFGSNAQIFAKRNFGKIADGLKGIVGGVGRGLGGAMSSGLGTAAPSLKRAFNVGLNGMEKLTQPGGGGMPRLPGSTNKLALGLLGGLLLFVLISGLLGAITGSAPPLNAAPLPPGGRDISSCKFTRSGSSQPIKSSILAGWISNAATRAGIPPAVLASIAMHENQDFTANADNNHDAIKTNQFCNRGLQFCEKNGQVLHSIPGQDDPCTPAEIAGGARTAQAVGLMQLLDIYNPGDLCSITNSLAIAAAKLKTNGITLQPTQDQINTAINGYYNSCTYGSYSYCNEVWQDLQDCQSTAPSGTASDCPVPGGIISFPSYNPATNTGHCGSDYNYSYCLCGTSGRRAKAIDVQTGGQNVVLPTINSQTANWTLINTYNVVEADGGGKGYTFKSNNNWYLDMLHLNSTLLTSGTEYPSGTIVAKTIGDHVHMTIGKNIYNALNPGSVETDCDPGWMASDFMCQ